MSYTTLKKDILALLCLTLLTGLFFYQTLLFRKLPVPSDALVGLYHPYRDSYAADYPNGVPFKNFLITDPVRQQIPWRKTVIDDIKKGQIPLWNAFTFSGTPLLANIQSGAFYPFNIFFLALPFATAWSLLIVSQPLLAGIFLYLFLRNRHLDVLSSLIGAIIFAFSGFSIAWLAWGTILSTWLWVPLSLLAIDQIEMERHKVRWAVILAFSVACSYFAGHLQLFIYHILLLLVYTLWIHHKSLRRQWMVYIIIVFIVAVFTSPQWLPMVKWLLQTSRATQGAAWQKEGFFIPIQHLVQFIVPDYFGNPTTLNYWGTWNYGEMVGYVGVVGLVLAILGMTAQTLFWTGMIVIALLIATYSPISLLPYQLHLPIISLLQPTRLLAVVDFSLAVLAGYGFSNLLSHKNDKRIRWVMIGILLVIAILWASILVNRFAIKLEDLAVAKRNLIVPTALLVGLFFLLSPFALLKKERLRLYAAILGVLLIGICVFDLFRFGWKFLPFTNSSYFFPQTNILSFLEKQQKPFRIMTTDDRILPPNVNEYYGIESVSGYDPIHSSRYEEFIAAMERGKPDIQPPFGFERIIAPKNVQSPLFRLLNVRYVLSFDPLPIAEFRPVAKEGKTIVYENTHFIPLVYLADDVLYKKNKQSVIDALYDSSFKPGLSAVTESPVDTLNIPRSLSDSVSISTYDDQKIDIRVAVANPRFLVIGNMYDAGWEVTIDGISTRLYRTNYLFIGVLVPKGNHRVTLRYR